MELQTQEHAAPPRAELLPVGDDALVAVIGSGGAIGSHAVPLLGRLRGVSGITLVDPDRYAMKNLDGQDILTGHVHRLKVETQRRRLGGIRPDLRVRALPCRVEDVPPGVLQGHVLVSCLDSRESRRVVNELAFRLGLPWIDTGVEPDGRLVRLSVFVPSEHGACLECSWDERHYATLEHRYPCQRRRREPAATNAPASLGALAAALAASECDKLLCEPAAFLEGGMQIVVDLRHHRHHVTRFERNPRCRFDHQTWSPHILDEDPADLDLRELEKRVRSLLEATGDRGATAGILRLRPAGRPFVRRLVCPSCGSSRRTLGLLGRLDARRRRCRDCGVDMEPPAFDVLDEIPLGAADLTGAPGPSPTLSRTRLSSLGFQPGDVVTIVDAEREIHVQLGKGSGWRPRRPRSAPTGEETAHEG